MQGPLHARAQAEKDAEGGIRGWVAAAAPGTGQPDHVGRLLAYESHVLDGRADVLTRDILAAEPMHKTAHGPQQARALVPLGMAENDRLATAKAGCCHRRF